MKLRFNPYFIMTVLIPALLSTGCGGVKFTSHEASSEASTTKITSGGGNGQGYDGKLRVLHHYVRDFTCENKSQPESILIRKNASDWFLIRNTKERCAAVDQVAVNQVVYNDVTKVAEFEGNIYVPPKPYIVDPNEDPNLPDVKVIDGVCEDINGKCSLRAAIDNAGIASWTADAVVLMAAAIYKIDKAVSLITGPNSHNVSLQGLDALSTVMDGQGVSDLLKINAQSGSINVDRITFKNAVVTAATTGAPGLAVSLSASNTRLIISNSIFKDNTGSNILYSLGNNDIEVKRSQFLNNASSFGDLYFFTAASVLIDQTTIDGSRSAGIYVLGGGITKIDITNSYIGSSNNGIILDTCSGCSISNTTINNNLGTGLTVDSFRPTPNPDVTLSNVTFANSLSGAGPHLQVDFESNPTYKLIVNNSIFSKSAPGASDCVFTNAVNYTHTIISTNSLFDDASCAVQGAGNIYGSNAQLSPAADNGGFTPTLLPGLTSPALSAGDPLTCLPTDQRGNTRPPKCDIGAVEIP